MRCWVLNCNFPLSTSEVQERYELTGYTWWLDGLVAGMRNGIGIGEWSAPKWAKVGDVCVLMCAKSAKSHVRHMQRDAAEARAAGSLLLSHGAEAALGTSLATCEKYGGLAFAWARCSSDAVDYGSHDGGWGNTVFARLGDLHVLEEPVSLLGMEPLIKISRFGGVTEMKGDGLAWMRAEMSIR